MRASKASEKEGREGEDDSPLPPLFCGPAGANYAFHIADHACARRGGEFSSEPRFERRSAVEMEG